MDSFRTGQARLLCKMVPRLPPESNGPASTGLVRKSKTDLGLCQRAENSSRIADYCADLSARKSGVLHPRAFCESGNFSCSLKKKILDMLIAI